MYTKPCEQYTMTDSSNVITLALLKGSANIDYSYIFVPLTQGYQQ